MERRFNRLTECHSCETAIFDEHRAQIEGRSWHESCLKCDDCEAVLTKRCFLRNDKFLCAEDYERRKRCFKCGKEIPRNEFIQKVKFFDESIIFHLPCLTCCICACRLSQGMEYIITDEGQLLCTSGLCTTRFGEEDQDIVDHVISRDRIGANNHVTSINPSVEKDVNETSIHPNSEFDWINSNNLDDVSLPDSVEFGLSSYGTDTNLSNQEIAPDQEASNLDSYEGAKNPSPEPANIKNKSKRRGPRTTIKPNQLEALKAAFEVSQKPAKSTRESLASETGLEMRVIQVWFQNRRSKERRVNQASKLNGNQSFYDGNMSQKYRPREAFPFLNSTFRDQRLFYPSTFAPASAGSSPHPGCFLSRSPWPHPASNERYNFQTETNAPSVTSQCPASMLRNKDINEEGFHSTLFQGEESRGTGGRTCSEPNVTNLTFDPYHINAKLDPGILWHHQ